MKPILKEIKKAHYFIMIMCFIYGGVSLIILIFQVYYFLRGQFSYVGDFRPERLANFTNYTGIRHGRFNALLSPFIIISFLGSVISIFAGLSLLDLLRKKERKEVTKDVVNSMIMPDEKIVIKELEKNNGELTQSELVRRTKLSKVKVHRIVKRLESLGIVSKYPYGVTNKIKLEKSLYED